MLNGCDEDATMYDAIIIGAGGAGLMCAVHAGRRGRRVLVLDHSEKIGRKILISGGGRCNFTNVHAGPANYKSSNPHFCKSALSRYRPSDFIAMVKAHHIAFHEKKDGQLFCNQSAGQIVDMLLSECKAVGVNIRAACRIHCLSYLDRSFVVDSSHGTFRAGNLVVATGGLSIPKIGATGFGYEIARQFGLRIEQTAPALVGFHLSDQDRRHFGDLSGVSFDSLVSCNKVSFRENTLFTHTGLSGPAMLQSSLYWHPGDQLLINVIPQDDITRWLVQSKRSGSRKELKNVLAEKLPVRLADKFCSVFCSSRPIADVSDKELKRLTQVLQSWPVVPAATFGYQKAEVTRGGVSTSDLSSTTMQAKAVQGLYFIGEVVDVTGWLGGFNFQWAWSSAYAAANAL